MDGPGGEEKAGGTREEKAGGNKGGNAKGREKLLFVNTIHRLIISMLFVGGWVYVSISP